MKIFPAIDIKDKKCVRLIKGDFEKKTEYDTSPIDQAAKLSLPTSLTATSNCLDGLKLLSVGIPTVPPTPIVKT